MIPKPAAILWLLLSSLVAVSVQAQTNTNRFLGTYTQSSNAANFYAYGSLGTGTSAPARLLPLAPFLTTQRGGEIWFTDSTDGATGTGTRNDPVRITNAATLHSFFPMTNGTHYRFLGGTYTVTNQLLLASTSSVVGIGARPVFSLATNAIPSGSKTHVFYGGESSPLSEVLLENLEIRVNGWQNISTNKALCGVAIYGLNDITLRGLEVTELKGDWDSGAESWAGIIVGPLQTNTAARMAGRFVIENCELVSTNSTTTNTSYCNGWVSLIEPRRYPNITNFYTPTVRDCRVIGRLNGRGSIDLAVKTNFSVFGAFAAGVVEKCEASEVAQGFYWEVQSTDLPFSIRDNVFNNCPSGIRLVSNTTNAASPLSIERNLFRCQGEAITGGGDSTNNGFRFIFLNGNRFLTNTPPFTNSNPRALGFVYATAFQQFVALNNIADPAIAAVNWPHGTPPNAYQFGNRSSLGGVFTNFADSSLSPFSGALTNSVGYGIESDGDFSGRDFYMAASRVFYLRGSGGPYLSSTAATNVTIHTQGGILVMPSSATRSVSGSEVAQLMIQVNGTNYFVPLKQ